MATAQRTPGPLADYETDFHQWSEDQAKALAARRAQDLDWDNLAEEIASLGRSDRREIRSRMRVIMLHLLKWQHQAEKRTAGWRSTLIEQRTQLAGLLEESPSLRNFPAQVLDREYKTARDEAADECGLPLPVFPRDCPFTVEQVVDETYYPD